MTPGSIPNSPAAPTRRRVWRTVCWVSRGGLSTCRCGGGDAFVRVGTGALGVGRAGCGVGSTAGGGSGIRSGAGSGSAVSSVSPSSGSSATARTIAVASASSPHTGAISSRCSTRPRKSVESSSRKPPGSRWTRAVTKTVPSPRGGARSSSPMRPRTCSALGQASGASQSSSTSAGNGTSGSPSSGPRAAARGEPDSTATKTASTTHTPVLTTTFCLSDHGQSSRHAPQNPTSSYPTGVWPSGKTGRHVVRSGQSGAPRSQ